MRLKRICICALLIIVPLYSQDWPTLQNTLLKFYRYQRSGLKPTTANSTGNPYNPFYTKTGSDGKYPHSGDGGSTPLDGGWYDAGDFMKFGLPLGFSVYCLLKGYDAFPNSDCYDDNNSWSALGTKDQIPDVLNEAKVATDYLIKAVVSSSQVVRDVGNGQSDHGSLSEDGYANSTRTAGRPVTNCDGADVPGFYAASLALMSILYKPYDTTYSATCLQKAKDAYTFGYGHQKLCSEMADANSPGGYYYSTTTWGDKMACAAIELYRATKDASYLAAAKTFFALVAQPHYDVLGYAHCSDLAAFEMYRSGDSTIKSTVLSSMSSNVSMEINRVVKTSAPLIGGASVNTTNWGTCRTAANAAFTAALLYSLTGNGELKTFVTQQISWLAGLGSFSRSWITQYGKSYPQNPHSRNDINLRPARLTGGVVSGPTSDCPATTADKSTCSWSFTDDNNTYKNTECALDYGCGAIGAVAFLRWINKTTDTVRINVAVSASPLNLDVATQSETISATLDKSVAWKLILEGQSSKAIKTYSGTGQAISVTGWKGDKDAGSADFTVEKINVYLDTTSMKIWNVQRQSATQASFNITNIPLKQPGANFKDVDNFNDTIVLTNELGGKWSGFSDLSDGVTGAKSSNPQITSDIGSDGTKGLYFTLTRSAGVATGGGPYAGIKTTFNTAGTAVDLGPADTMLIDIKPLGANSSLSVELEQSDIIDKAYFGRTLTLGSANAWTRIAIPFISLTQPAWKTTAKTLGTKRAVSIRLVGYGPTSDRYVIDNLKISNMSISASSVHNTLKRIAQTSGKNVEFFKISAASVSYAIFFSGSQGATLKAELFDCLGKSIISYNVKDYQTGSAIAISGIALHTGIYFLKHTVIGSNKSVIVPFMVTK